MAFGFDGSTDALHASTTLLPGSNTTEWTLSIWYYRPTGTDAGWVGMTGTYTDFEEYEGIYQKSDGYVLCQAGANGTADSNAQSGNTSTTAGWNHFIATFQPSNRTIMVNGDTANKGTNTGTQLVETCDTALIGCQYGAGGPLPQGFCTGWIAEYAAYTAILSEQDQLQLSKGFSPLLVRPDKLAVYAPIWPNAAQAKREYITGLSFTTEGTPDNQPHPPIFQASAQIIPFPPAAAAAGSYTIYNNYYRQLMAGNV